MFIKIIIIGALAGVLLALGSALFQMVSGKGAGTGTVKALTWRIGISVALFLLIMTGIAMGWITPHGVQP